MTKTKNIRLLRIVNWTSVVFMIIFLWALLWWNQMDADLLPRYDNPDFQINLFMYFLISFLVSLITYVLIKRKAHITGLAILGVMLFAVFIYFLMLAMAFSDMCIWTVDRSLYQHKANRNIGIVQRSMGCGAIDGGPPVVDTFLAVQKFNFYIEYEKFETKIDTTIWIPIFNN